MCFSNTKKISFRAKGLVSLTALGFSLLLIFTGCFDMGETYTKLPPGPWRGVLKLDPDLALHAQLQRETPRQQTVIIDEVSDAELPFNFNVVYDSEEDFHFEIFNGEEKIIVDDIYYGVDRATSRDTVRAYFEAYDSYLEVLFDNNVMEGYWYVPSRGSYQVSFVAHHGKNHRFSELRKPPVADLSGKWETYFEVETDAPSPAIGEFLQDGNHLTGTFRTETGDYRFLEGTVQADKMYLSCFDGAHMFLFEGKISEDGSINGLFRNGTHYITSWTAQRNDGFELTSPDSLTQMLTDEPLAFSFPNSSGKLVSLDDPSFAGKAKLIQITGTWCPNCLDETQFLVDYLKTHKNENLAVIALAFERHTDPVRARANLARYRDRLGIPYPVLHAGLSDKSAAGRQLPMLNEVISYPTLLFLDKDNQVVRIHTGFNGPATSKFEEFKKDFKETIDQITS